MKEEQLQLSVCAYLAHKYPNLIFHCDVGSGVRLPIGVAKRASKMRSNNGYPDLFIVEPIGQYHGLYLELKREGMVLYNKNGSLRSGGHLKSQSEMHERLRRKGFACFFAVGIDEAINLIEAYLKKRELPF